MIRLSISKKGEIKNLEIVKSSDESNDKYLMEIGNQIQILKPAVKNGQPIGTRFVFKIDL